MAKVVRWVSGMNTWRNVGTGRRGHWKIRRHDKSQPELRAGKLPAFNRVADDNVVRVIRQCDRLVTETAQAFEKNLYSSLHGSPLRNRRRTGRDNLETLAIVELDALVTLAFIADTMMAL